MGSVDVDVELLELDGEPIYGWYMLEDPAGGTLISCLVLCILVVYIHDSYTSSLPEPEAFGEVELTVRWITRPNTGPDAIISVNILSAQELPPIGGNGFVDPFVQVIYSGDTDDIKETDTRVRAMDPVWREILEFPAKSGEVGSEHVEVRVFHKVEILKSQLPVKPTT